LIGNLSGILTNHSVRAIDFRPADGRLYALSTLNNSFQIYTVDLATAALTAVGAGGTVADNFPTRVSMDFNPAADRIRVVTGANDSYRFNPITGAFVAQDTDVAYVAGDPNFGSNPPQIVGVAYDRNDNEAGTPTTMFAYDFDLDVLVRVGSVNGTPDSPNTGFGNTIGGSGIVAADGGVGFDISGATGVGFLSWSAGGVENFGSINLGTGAVTTIGAFNGLDVLDFSVSAIPEPGTLSLVGGLAALAAFSRRRRLA
jgi:hypothetical protein